MKPLQFFRQHKIFAIIAVAFVLCLISLMLYTLCNEKPGKKHSYSRSTAARTERDPNAPDPATMEPGKVYDYVATNGAYVSAMLIESTLQDNNESGFVNTTAYAELVSSTDKNNLPGKESAFPIRSQSFTDLYGNSQTFYYQLTQQIIEFEPTINETNIRNQIDSDVHNLTNLLKQNNMSFEDITEADKEIIFEFRKNETQAHETQHKTDYEALPILCVYCHNNLTQLIQSGQKYKISATDKQKAAVLHASLLHNEYDATVVMESRAVATGIKQIHSDFSGLQSPKDNTTPANVTETTPQKFESAYLLVDTNEKYVTKARYLSAKEEDRKLWHIHTSLARKNVMIQHPTDGVTIDTTQQKTYRDAYNLYFQNNDYNEGMNKSAKALTNLAINREQYISDLLAINHLYRFYKNNLPDDSAKSTSTAATAAIADWEQEKPSITLWLNEFTNELNKINGPYNPKSETAKKIKKLLTIYPKYEHDNEAAQSEAKYNFYLAVIKLAEHNFYSLPNLKRGLLYDKNTWCYYIDEAQRNCSRLFTHPSPSDITHFYTHNFYIRDMYKKESKAAHNLGPFDIIDKRKELLWLLENKSEECGTYSANYFKNFIKGYQK